MCVLLLITSGVAGEEIVGHSWTMILHDIVILATIPFECQCFTCGSCCTGTSYLTYFVLIRMKVTQFIADGRFWQLEPSFAGPYVVLSTHPDHSVDMSNDSVRVPSSCTTVRRII